MPALEKILIIRFSSIGDIVLASPLIRVLRKSFPDAQIDFLVKSEYTELVRYNPNLSSVLEFRDSGYQGLRSLKKRIRENRYDAIFDIHNSNRSRYLRFFSGARHVGVVNKHVVARFMLVNFKWHLYPDKISPVAERYLETVASFGVSDDGGGLDVFLPDEPLAAVSAQMSRLQLDKYESHVGFVPTSKHFTKRWPAEKFVELGVSVAKNERAKIIVFGGKEEVDYCGDIAQMINARAGWSAAESIAGKLSLLETAAAFDSCHVVVTNDTGLMHLAAARKRRVIAIFGSTVREFGFFPYGTESVVIQQEGLPCRPCTHIGLSACPRGHFRCMKDISAAGVYDTVQSLLNRESTSTSIRYA